MGEYPSDEIYECDFNGQDPVINLVLDDDT